MLIDKSKECITFLWFKTDIVTKGHNSKNRGRVFPIVQYVVTHLNDKKVTMKIF